MIWYNTRMPKDHQHNPDPNASAARNVGKATIDTTAAVANRESAWVEWSSHLQKVDEQTMALLRAAFEAGWEAARQLTNR